MNRKAPLIGILLALSSAILPELSLAGSAFQADLVISAKISRKIAQDSTVRQAAAVLAAKSVADVDGYALPPVPDMNGSATGGGGVPAASGAPVSDDQGVPLGYCAWDNGSSTGATGYIPGTNSIAAVTLAVISPGADNHFSTTCAQIAAGQRASGDDFYVAYTAGQIAAGVQGSSYFADPVATVGDLSGLSASALSDGQVRLVKSSNLLYRYRQATGTWSSISGSGGSSQWQATGVAEDIFFDAGKVAIGTPSATHALSVRSTSTPVGISSTGIRNGVDLLNPVTSVVNAFFGFDSGLNQVRLEALKAGSGLVMTTGGGSVTVNSSGVLEAPQGILAAAITSTGAISTAAIQSSGPLSISSTGLTVDGPAAFSGSVTAATVTAAAITVAGEGVWHSGNFVPGSKANTAVQIIAGPGLVGGGDLSESRAISLPDTGVAAGTYSSSAITVDSKGRITAVAPARLVGNYSGVVSANEIFLAANTAASSNYAAKFSNDKWCFSAATLNCDIATGVLNVKAASTTAIGIATDGSISAGGTVTASGMTLTSDARLKNTIKPISIDDVRSRFMAVRPVSYNLNVDNAHHTGYIAQELELQFPYMTRIDANGYYSVSYIDMIPVIHSVVQEHEKSIALIKSRMTIKEDGKTSLMGYGEIALEVLNSDNIAIASFRKNGDLDLGGLVRLKAARGGLSFDATGTTLTSATSGEIVVNSNAIMRAAVRLQHSADGAQAASVYGMLFGDESGIGLADAAGKSLLVASTDKDGVSNVKVLASLYVGNGKSSIIHLEGGAVIAADGDGSMQLGASRGVRIFNPDTNEAVINLGSDGAIEAKKFIPTQVVERGGDCGSSVGAIARDSNGQPMVCTK